MPVDRVIQVKKRIFDYEDIEKKDWTIIKAKELSSKIEIENKSLVAEQFTGLLTGCAVRREGCGLCLHAVGGAKGGGSSLSWRLYNN